MATRPHCTLECQHLPRLWAISSAFGKWITAEALESKEFKPSTRLYPPGLSRTFDRCGKISRRASLSERWETCEGSINVCPSNLYYHQIIAYLSILGGYQTCLPLARLATQPKGKPALCIMLIVIIIPTRPAVLMHSTSPVIPSSHAPLPPQVLHQLLHLSSHLLLQLLLRLA